MKKLILIAVLSVTLTSCSWFDSPPIEPNILGVANLQYDNTSGLWLAVIDSTQYTVSAITIPDHDPRSIGVTQDIQPIDGMLVTVFTSPRMLGIQAVAGKQSEAQIEELYHSNFTVFLIFAILMLLFLIVFAWPVVKADV